MHKTYSLVSHMPIIMSKAGGRGTDGMAMAIPIFVKPDILPHLTVTLPRGLLYTHACSDLV